MADYKVAYGNKELIEPAIQEGVIPPGCIILTDDTNEMLFYDLDGNLKIYEARKEFPDKESAELWIQSYDCAGQIISIHENGACYAYIVEYTGELTPLASTGKDGLTPYIKDGYWWIGEENTNVKAKGDKGDPYTLTESDKERIVQDVLTTLPYYDGTVEDVEVVELISFTIEGTTYQAEDGMTWEQWVESEYNTAGASINSNSTIHTAVGTVGDIELEDATVYDTDLIIAGASYSVEHVGGSN